MMKSFSQYLYESPTTLHAHHVHHEYKAFIEFVEKTGIEVEFVGRLHNEAYAFKVK